MYAILRNWRGGLWLKGLLALLLIALGDTLFFQRGLGAGYFGLFFLALLAALVLARPAARREGRAWAAIVPGAVYALAMSYDPSLLAWTMFWIAAGMATLLPGTGRFDDGWRWFQRLLFHAFTACFGPLIDMVKVLKVRRKRPPSSLNLRGFLPILALPLVGSAVILALFSAANPIVEALLLSIRLPEASYENLARLTLWLTLFTLSWAVLRPRLPRCLIPTFDGSGDLALPGVSVGSVTLSLIAFNLLFATQNVMDVA